MTPDPTELMSYDEALERFDPALGHSVVGHPFTLAQGFNRGGEVSPVVQLYLPSATGWRAA